MKRALNARQQALLARLRDLAAQGYVFGRCYRSAFGGGASWRAHQGGLGRGGRVLSLPFQTMEALCDRGYLWRRQGDWCCAWSVGRAGKVESVVSVSFVLTTPEAPNA